jgi:vacuolar-type H+-ATPase subunit F/Vma7
MVSIIVIVDTEHVVGVYYVGIATLKIAHDILNKKERPTESTRRALKASV